MKVHFLTLLTALGRACSEDTSGSSLLDVGISIPNTGDALEQSLEIDASVENANNWNVTGVAGIGQRLDNRTDTALIENVGMSLPQQSNETELSSDGILLPEVVSNDRSLEEELAQTKAELANVISQLNDSFHYSKSLEDKLERIQSVHLRELNETFTELEAISNESDRYKRQLDQNEERCKDMRKKLNEREQELRAMHHDAVNQYVNFTLIGSDIVEFAQDVVSSVTSHVDRKLGRSTAVHHRMNHARRNTKSRYSSAKRYLQLKFGSTQRRFSRHWDKSEIVRPFFEQTWGKVAKYTFDVYHPYKPMVNDMKYALHLSSLSAIEVTSKGVLSYLDNHVKRKEEREKRRRERDKEMAERHGRHHRPPPRKTPKDIKVSSKGEVTAEPPYLHKKIRPIFKFALDNAEKLVTQGTALLPLFVTLFFGKSLVLGSFLYFFIEMPVELVWVLAIERLYRRFKKHYIENSC